MLVLWQHERVQLMSRTHKVLSWKIKAFPPENVITPACSLKGEQWPNPSHEA